MFAHRDVERKQHLWLLVGIALFTYDFLIIESDRFQIVYLAYDFERIDIRSSYIANHDIHLNIFPGFLVSEPSVEILQLQCLLRHVANINNELHTQGSKTAYAIPCQAIPIIVVYEEVIALRLTDRTNATPCSFHHGSRLIIFIPNENGLSLNDFP